MNSKTCRILNGVPVFCFVNVILKCFIVLAFIPIFLTFICPIYLIRGLVLLASKVLRPDLIQILGVRDTFYGIDNINSNPKSSIVVTHILEGKLDLETTINRMKHVVSLPGPNKSEYRYPELRRYLVNWMGFLFWKEDKDFRVENHVKYHKTGNQDKNGNLFAEKINEEYLKHLENQIVNEPYYPGRSAWEIEIVQNYTPRQRDEGVDEYSVVLFKIHHSFVDGYSLVRLALTAICEGNPEDLPLPQSPNRANFILKVFQKIFILIKAPYDTLTEVLEESDKNFLHLSPKKVTNEITSALSTKIPTLLFKTIAQQFEVSFTAVVIASVSGGIRNWAEKIGKPIPDTLKCLCPFPVPGHPDSLCNYLSDCSIELPAGIQDPVLRLKHVESNLKKLKFSTTPLSSFAVQPLLGGLFTWMLEPLIKFACAKSTGVLSSFPAPRKQTKWCGLPVSDVYFTGGHDSPGFGVQFLAISYNGNWKLKIQADKAVIPSDSDVEELLNCIVTCLNDYFHHTMV